ncbi:hypothetical protein [Methylacidimicrobium tartarophylax]|uniref:hypothetical protein n=1 Tax=Methylacidimicrobium tartarophylax TaxID=1041768 RepID=UPI0015B63134|nr:hypothetical protein [Methylacidimicrobium tartarophylax]
MCPSAAQAEDPQEAALWQSASQGAVSQLQIYLRQYPGGAHATAARSALVPLQASQSSATPQASTPMQARQPARQAGWMIEVRAYHQQQQDPLTPAPYAPWVVDPAALALRPMPGPRFDLRAIGRSVRGAGAMPAVAGSAKWAVRQAGRSSIGARCRWNRTFVVSFSLRVNGNRILDRSVGQVGLPSSGEETFGATVELEPGVYDVAWTFEAQPPWATYAISDEDASLEILTGAPGEALAAPTPGEFFHQ